MCLSHLQPLHKQVADPNYWQPVSGEIIDMSPNIGYPGALSQSTELNNLRQYVNAIPNGYSYFAHTEPGTAPITDSEAPQLIKIVEDTRKTVRIGSQCAFNASLVAASTDEQLDEFDRVAHQIVHHSLAKNLLGLAYFEVENGKLIQVTREVHFARTIDAEKQIGVGRPNYQNYIDLEIVGLFGLSAHVKQMTSPESRIVPILPSGSIYTIQPGEERKVVATGLATVELNPPTGGSKARIGRAAKHLARLSHGNTLPQAA